MVTIVWSVRGKLDYVLHNVKYESRKEPTSVHQLTETIAYWERNINTKKSCRHSNLTLVVPVIFSLVQQLEYENRDRPGINTCRVCVLIKDNMLLSPEKRANIIKTLHWKVTLLHGIVLNIFGRSDNYLIVYQTLTLVEPCTCCSVTGRPEAINVARWDKFKSKILCYDYEYMYYDRNKIIITGISMEWS